MLGYHTRPPSEHSNTLTARTEVCPDIAALEECLKGGDAGRWHKVAQKSFPGVSIVLAQERHQLLFGVIRGRELQIISKQRAVPPANFIIREIANAVGTAFVWRHQTMRPGAHVLFHGWAKGIAPDEKRLASEFQVGHERQGELRWRQRPSPGSIKAPGGEPLESGCHPVLERRVERTPVIRQTPFVDATRVAAIQHIDANGPKALTT